MPVDCAFELLGLRNLRLYLERRCRNGLLGRARLAGEP